jgi:multicomponent Na+:H+ antiporter subunit G
MIRTVLGVTLLCAGLFVFSVGVMGLFRLDHILKRLHAVALGDTMGIFLTLAGLALLFGFGTGGVKLLFVLLFLWISGPLVTHLITETETLMERKWLPEELLLPDAPPAPEQTLTPEKEGQP